MGSLSGGNSCLKYLVFIFNFLFFIIGCGLLGIGIYLKVGKTDYINVAEQLSSASKYITAGNLMLAVGIIILVVAFLGCCGAVLENQCMLLAFFILLAIIFLLELAAGIFGIVKKDEIEDSLKKDFEDAIDNKYLNGTTDSVIKKTIDNFQRNFKCCGYSGWKDWRDSKYYKDTDTIPSSCCIDETSSKCHVTVNPDPNQFYKKGCFKEVTDFFKKNIYIVGACGIAFAVIQILGLVFSMLLYCAIKRAGSGIMA